MIFSGHSNPSFLLGAVSEALASAVFVFFAAGSAAIQPALGAGGGGVAGALFVGWVHGLVLFAMTFITMPISGGHINPIIVIGCSDGSSSSGLRRAQVGGLADHKAEFEKRTIRRLSQSGVESAVGTEGDLHEKIHLLVVPGMDSGRDGGIHPGVRAPVGRIRDGKRSGKARHRGGILRGERPGVRDHRRCPNLPGHNNHDNPIRRAPVRPLRYGADAGLRDHAGISDKRCGNKPAQALWPHPRIQHVESQHRLDMVRRTSPGIDGGPVDLLDTLRILVVGQGIGRSGET